jgi:hypothetical protein
VLFACRKSLLTVVATFRAATVRERSSGGTESRGHRPSITVLKRNILL